MIEINLSAFHLFSNKKLLIKIVKNLKTETYTNNFRRETQITITFSVQLSLIRDLRMRFYLHRQSEARNSRGGNCFGGIIFNVPPFFNDPCNGI